MVNYINLIYRINKFWEYIKLSYSFITTVVIDLQNISENVIYFDQAYDDFIAYKVIASDTDFNKRSLSWFYKSFDVPTIEDWELYLKVMKLESVPYHIIQLYDSNYDTLDKPIIIHKISNEGVKYSYKNMTVESPIIPGILLPERYLYNIKKYHNYNRN